MIICIDFDDTIVSQAGRSYEDVTTPLRLLSGVKTALKAFKRAGHILILYSARSNRAIREDAQLDPLVRKGIIKPSQNWDKAKGIAHARYLQMVDFVATELPGLFDVIDDGRQGKPQADLFIDDKCVQIGHGVFGSNWSRLTLIYGEPIYGSEESNNVPS